MQGTSKATLAIRNIGDSSHEGEIFEGTLTEVLKQAIEFIGKTTIRKRFDISISRERDHAVNHILGTRAKRSIEDELNQDALDALLSMVPDEEDDSSNPSTTPSADIVINTDGWKPPRLGRQ